MSQLPAAPPPQQPYGAPPPGTPPPSDPGSIAGWTPLPWTAGPGAQAGWPIYAADTRPFWPRSLVTVGYVVLVVLIGIVIALVATVDELSSR